MALQSCSFQSPQPVLLHIPPSQRWGNIMLIPKQLQVGVFLPKYPDSTPSHLQTAHVILRKSCCVFFCLCVLIAPSWNLRTIRTQCGKHSLSHCSPSTGFMEPLVITLCFPGFFSLQPPFSEPVPPRSLSLQTSPPPPRGIPGVWE